MNINIITYVRGSAGNFFLRTLALDPTSVALGSGPYQHLTLAERQAQYAYVNTPKLPVGPEGQEWWNYELKNQRPMTRLGIPELETLNHVIMETTHPENFDSFISNFGDNDVIKHLYIDITDCEDWVLEQQRRKLGIIENQDTRMKDACDRLESIKSTHAMHDIRLKPIIDDDLGFLQEYHEACEYLGLVHYPREALILYRQWIKTWR